MEPRDPEQCRYPFPQVYVEENRLDVTIHLSRKDAATLALALFGGASWQPRGTRTPAGAPVTFSAVPSGIRLLKNALDRELTATPVPPSLSNARPGVPAAPEAKPQCLTHADGTPKQPYADASDVNPRAGQTLRSQHLWPPEWLICPLPGQADYGLTECVLMRWNGRGYDVRYRCASTQEAQRIIDSVPVRKS